MKPGIAVRLKGRAALVGAMCVVAMSIGFTTAGSAVAADVDLVASGKIPGTVDLVRAKSKARVKLDYLHAAPLMGVRSKPLEIWAHREGPDRKVQTDLIDRATGSPVAKPVADQESLMDVGLARFISIRILDAKGKVVNSWRDSICPNGFQDYAYAPAPSRKRVRRLAMYPGEGFYREPCGEELAESLVWLVRKNRPAPFVNGVALALPDGRYRYEVTINPDRLVPESNYSNNTFFQAFRVQTNRKLWRKLAGGGMPMPTFFQGGLGKRDRGVKPPTVAEIGGRPGDLPDVVALPATKFSLEGSGGRQQLGFSSLIGNLGKAPIALFGSRTGTAGRTMPGWQYLKGADGRLVRRKTNGFVWDHRDGHLHWHYNRLAVYELLSMGGNVVRRSGKVGFCFMPTNALRFVPVPGRIGKGVPYVPDEANLPVDCGARKSKRVTMSLQPGWGDQYYQAIAGQSFDVTTLPNGSYRLKITVNAQGDLAEESSLNNVAERVVQLSGTGSRRQLTVPREGVASPEFTRLKRYGGVTFLGAPAAGGEVEGVAGGAQPPRLYCGLRPS